MKRKFTWTGLQWSVAAFAVMLSPSLYALGLGGVEVQSYLGEPLQARIRLLGPTVDELGSVTADLASVSDLEMMGISRSVSVPLHFDVNNDADDPFIAVSSRLPVNDPVVQVVVEVRWSGGRMLREYTLFLDPPTVPSAAPAPRVFRAPPPGPDIPDPENISVVGAPARDQGRTATPAAPVRGEIGPAEPVVPEQQLSGPVTPPGETTEQSGSQAGTAPPSRARPSHAETGAEEYGPVKRGETLWGIASDFVAGSDYSVNQAMLAIQRLNPDAFGGQNINSLHRGAILQMPTMDEVGRLTRRDAMLEAMRQERQYLARRSAPPADALPTVADTSFATGPDSVPDSDDSPGVAVTAVDDETGRLQLVPPSGPDGGEEPAGTGAEATGAVASGDVEEVLARTEEELANAQQENAYLSDRIRELESELEAAKTAGAVADSELAAMEERLRESRLSDDSAGDAGESQEPESRKGGSAWWLIGLLVLAVAGVVWFLRKTGSGGEGAVSAQEGTSGEEAPAEVEETPVNEREAETEHAEPRESRRPPRAQVNDEEAVELDSNDPEVKLDLARAYISMGDPGAARQMLKEVIEIGNEQQVAEAREMMREI